MAIYAPKAAENIWFKARERATEFNDRFGSREGASDELGIERTRLARIETGVSTPHTDEVVMMSECYKAPELRNYYCRECCPLGSNVPAIEDASLDRISVRAMSSLRKVAKVKEMLLDIVDDGIIDESEKPELEEIIKTLDELNEINQNLKCWSQKNLK